MHSNKSFPTSTNVVLGLDPTITSNCYFSAVNQCSCCSSYLLVSSATEQYATGICILSVSHDESFANSRYVSSSNDTQPCSRPNVSEWPHAPLQSTDVGDCGRSYTSRSWHHDETGRIALSWSNDVPLSRIHSTTASLNAYSTSHTKR